MCGLGPYYLIMVPDLHASPLAPSAVSGVFQAKLALTALAVENLTLLEDKSVTASKPDTSDNSVAHSGVSGREDGGGY
jgi:hypothetical protein